MQYRFLMCAPDYFGVEYVINPWMEGKLGTAQEAVARAQWNALFHLIQETMGATVVTVPSQSGLPDLVFTANAATVRSGVALLSHFCYPERQGEEPHYRIALAEAGYEVYDLPEGIAFEGAGDALFQEEETDEKPILWAAHGFRTDRESHAILAETFGAQVISLHLIDPRFYHLDTCFCPLPGGYALWYPPAFDADSQTVIRATLPEEKQFAVSDADAAAFTCNAVAVGPNIVLNAASAELMEKLTEWGFQTYVTPLTEFMKAGGSAKCLTLRLT